MRKWRRLNDWRRRMRPSKGDDPSYERPSKKCVDNFNGDGLRMFSLLGYDRRQKIEEDQSNGCSKTQNDF